MCIVEFPEGKKCGYDAGDNFFIAVNASSSNAILSNLSYYVVPSKLDGWLAAQTVIINSLTIFLKNR